MALLRAPPAPPAAPLSLTERIEKLHEEIEAFIDAKVEEARKEAGGFVPAVRIKHDLMTKVSWCKCSAVEYLEKQP